MTLVLADETDWEPGIWRDLVESFVKLAGSFDLAECIQPLGRSSGPQRGNGGKAYPEFAKSWELVERDFDSVSNDAPHRLMWKEAQFWSACVRVSLPIT